jgi:general secretion pathway protein B
VSYILDALKKAEKERQRAALPDMLKVQDIIAEKPAKRLHWVYLLTAALLLNAGVFVWWLEFSHKEKAKIVETSASPLLVNDTVPERPKPSPDSAQSISPELEPVDIISVQTIENTSSTASDKTSKNLQEEPKAHDYPVSTINTVKPSELSPAQLKKSEEAVSLPSGTNEGAEKLIDENKIYKLRELPLSVRQSLPLFSISALMYSDNPAARMVRINDQMMHEGQDLTPGVKLEEISKDGVICRHQKYRFYVGVK